MRKLLTCLLIVGLFAGKAPAQQDLVERSRQILDAIGLSSDLGSEEMYLEETDFGAVRVKSKRINFSYAGYRGPMMSFQWEDKLDELRRRGPNRGTHFTGKGDAARRVLEFLGALVTDPERWRPFEEHVVGDDLDSQKYEFQNTITAKLERVVNGLVVYGENVTVTFDTMDGEVASIYVSTRSQDAFMDRSDLLTPAQAEDTARRHATQFLRNSSRWQSQADGIVGEFLPPGETDVSLTYGPLFPGFDSKYKDYTTRNLVPPVYKVDFGNVMLFIQAKTGECVGGILDAEGSGTPVAPSGKRQPGSQVKGGTGDGTAAGSDASKSDRAQSLLS